MKPKTFTLRFHMNDPKHRQAYGYLQSLSGSKNAAIISVLNHVAEQEDYWNTFRRVLREEMGNVQPVPSGPAPTATEGADELVMDALEFFR